MSAATTCMGGWCARRDKCPHHAADLDVEPAERLCLPGRDGVMLAMVHRESVEVQADDVRVVRVVHVRRAAPAWPGERARA